MKILKWTEGMSEAEERKVGLWERNMLALRYATYWIESSIMGYKSRALVLMRGNGFNCLVLVPDDFNIGNLQKAREWDQPTLGVMPQESEDPYAERNRIAEWFGDGWYNDDKEFVPVPGDGERAMVPNYPGWRRVISCDNGAMTFHIPDDFQILDLEMVGLPQIERNWDGHTTEEKWRRVFELRGIREKRGE